jgi:hypothetical protein
VQRRVKKEHVHLFLIFPPDFDQNVNIPSQCRNADVLK